MDRMHGSQTRGRNNVPQGPEFEGRFGRMFWNLPVFNPSDLILEELANAMEASPGDVANQTLPAGFTYLGQFVDHDITHDASSSFERVRDPDARVNFRTPRFDLDSLYGRGPVDSPFLYEMDAESKTRMKLVVGQVTEGVAATLDNGTRTSVDVPVDNEFDLPRNSNGVALIGDPRNDENTFVSQLHLLFIKFHNKVVDHVAATEAFTPGEDLMKEAQRLVRWHYQWIVVNDYLKRTVPADVFDSILITDPATGFRRVETRFYDLDREPYMPVEFSVAAYRFGHSQVRSRYGLNGTVRDLATFEPDSQLPDDPEARRKADFRGFKRLPERWQPDWPLFFELDGTPPQMTNRIDTSLSLPLHNLPEEDPNVRFRHSLAFRNLKRSVLQSLPTGEWVANAMGKPRIDNPLTKGRTPLWYYILDEADKQESGLRLGNVGGRIVAETLLGLLAGDPLSFINVQPNWSPDLLTDDGQPVNSMANLIRYADPLNAVRDDEGGGGPEEPSPWNG